MQKERRGWREGFVEGDTELGHVESKEPTMQERGEAPRQRAQPEQMGVSVSHARSIVIAGEGSPVMYMGKHAAKHISLPQDFQSL